MYKFDNNLLKDPQFLELANRDIKEHFIYNSDPSLTITSTFNHADPIDLNNISKDLDPTLYQYIPQQINPHLSSQSLITTLRGTAIKRTITLKREKQQLISSLEDRIKYENYIIENSPHNNMNDSLTTLANLKL